MMLEFKNKKIYFVLIPLLLIAIFFCNQVLSNGNSQAENISVNIYDVGQGDAIHIRRGNQDVLIDGGPDSRIVEKLGENIPFSDNEIELVILTHPHEDHVAGLIHVLEKYKVDEILQTDVGYNSNMFSEWQRLIEEKGIKETIAKVGQIVRLKGANLYILFPNSEYTGEEIKNLNNASIVAKLVFGSSSFLFTGDAEKEEEQELLDNYSKDILASNLLKVGHHGSKTASTKEFLEQVNPAYAVISDGKDNKFGHPHQETLDKLKDLNIKLFRTDEDGDVKCVSDGESVKCNE